MLVIEAPAGAAGGVATLMAAGFGDADPVLAELAVSGETLRPPSPVHLEVERRPSGDAAIRWIRRSRAGWSWLSGAETPLGEEQENYLLTISGGGSPPRMVATQEPEWLYSAADQAAEARSGEFHVAVRQVGTFATSRAAEFTFVQP